MSHYPPTQSNPFGQPQTPNTGLAVGALVCGIVGFFIPLVGLVGVVLGIRSMSKASREPQTYGGSGLAVAGIITGAIGTLFTLFFCGSLALGIFLPAIGKARNTARLAAIQQNLREIGMGLNSYAIANKDWYPEAGTDWQSRLGLPASVFVSRRGNKAAAAADSLIYVPGFHLPDLDAPANAIVIYENPKYVERGNLAILYVDGHVELWQKNALKSRLETAEKPGGKPPPSPTSPTCAPHSGS